MHNILLILLLLFTALCAKDIRPVAVLQTSGLVNDFVKDGDFLYVATDAGVVDIIDLFERKIVRQIHFEPLKTTMGNLVPPQVHSIDRFEGKTLLVTSGISAWRNVWIDDGETLKRVIDESKHFMPKHAFFTNKGKILLGTIGSDIALYDSKETYTLYNNHISQSAMGGMVLNAAKTKMIISDESGTVRLIDIKTSKIEKIFSSEHVDNIYTVAYAHDTLLTAGQDRRVGIYHKDSSFHIKSDFLVYAVGISPDAKMGIYSSSEAHHLQLFHTLTGKKTDRLIGHHATPSKIQFIDNKTLISAGDEYKIYFWVIP